MLCLYHDHKGLPPDQQSLRDMKHKVECRVVILPVTTHHLNETVKNLCTLTVKSTVKNVPLDLYRGVSHVSLEHDFLVEGGTEVHEVDPISVLHRGVFVSETDNEIEIEFSNGRELVTGRTRL